MCFSDSDMLLTSRRRPFGTSSCSAIRIESVTWMDSGSGLPIEWLQMKRFLFAVLPTMLSYNLFSSVFFCFFLFFIQTWYVSHWRAFPALLLEQLKLSRRVDVGEWKKASYGVESGADQSTGVSMFGQSYSLMRTRQKIYSLAVRVKSL